MNLVPLYEEAIQFNDYNGTVLAAGKVEVWYLGRTRKADIYADVAGETPLPNPLDLNDLGMQEVYVNPAFNYTLVVYDPYGSELFSVDKYLQGAGAHTTSNVVVQPSEHIGVSAWTVGEVQIYQPYLVGDVGKTYEGISPIVVNNVEDKISAQHVPLGVQDPLYFVQDDEEGCIIGLSGGVVPEGTMNESALGYQDGQITSYNGSALGGNSTLTLRTNGIKEGTYDTLGTYAPLGGSKNIDIPREVYTFTIGNQSCFYNDVIMAYLNSKVIVALEIESWYEDGQQKQNVYENFAQKQFWGDNNFYNGGYVNFVRVDVEKNQIVTWKCEPETPGSITGYAKWTKTVTDLGSGGLFIAEYGNPGTTYEEIDAAFNAGKTVIAHKKEGRIDQYYQLCEIRKYPDLPVNVDCYVFAYRYSYIVEELFRFQSNWSNMETRLATWDYVDQQISAGDFATHSDLSSYATQNWVNNQGFLTAHQSLEGYATENWVSSQGYLTAHQSLDDLMSANLLEISDNKITGYNGTAFAGTTVSGDFELSAGSGISIVDYPLEQKTVISVTAQGGNPEVEQAVINNSATWDSVTSKADVTALSNYQTTAGMTAYMATGDSANFYTTANESGFVTSGELPDPITIGVQEGDTLDTDYDGLKIVKATANGNEHINLHKKSTDQWLIHGNLVPTSPGSNKYLITDDSGAMHWDNKSALAYDSAFEQSGGYITAYNGSAFKAGDELPSGVMVESGLEYNAVNEISGYNGSAIAQYGAEKQWLQHDDTLVHAANSAQYALGVNVSAVGELLGVSGPVLNQETFAGHWNGQPLYQQLVSMVFNSNSTSTGGIPLEARPSAVDNGQRWIDPNNSFIHYGSVNISLPISWMLASDRRGSICLNSNALNYRGIDTVNTQCTAYVCIKYRKA